jgi:hypothetical protein
MFRKIIFAIAAIICARFIINEGVASINLKGNASAQMKGAHEAPWLCLHIARYSMAMICYCYMKFICSRVAMP